MCQSIKKKLSKLAPELTVRLSYIQIVTVRCKTEAKGKPAASVSDQAIFCKTKKRQIGVLKLNEDYLPFGTVKFTVPVDCIAYKKKTVNHFQ